MKLVGPDSKGSHGTGRSCFFMSVKRGDYRSKQLNISLVESPRLTAAWKNKRPGLQKCKRSRYHPSSTQR
jgi:hypothetical protein